MQVYVSPNGRDTWTGDRSTANKSHTDGPLATLAGARDRIRSLAVKPGNITVWLEPGTYYQATPFTLTTQDSAAANGSITYRAMPRAQVRVTGGQAVNHWSAVVDPAVLHRLSASAATHVLVANLKAQGIADYGQLGERGFGRPVTPAGLELFFNNRPMELARWPQSGWARITAVQSDANQTTLTYAGDEPAKWPAGEDVWLYGYWAFEWADEYLPVNSIDSQAHAFRVPPNIPLGATAGARYRALNILEELNAPGEYILDRASGKLYFWPPTPITPGSAVVSVGTALVSMIGVSNVALEGFTLGDCRGTAVTFTNSSNCRVVGCVLRNIGNNAVVADGGSGNGVVGCDISDTGDGAVEITAGDRTTLTPGGSFVDNCDIGRFSRWDRTYTPAVALNGVGDCVTHCRIHDAPHAAIIITGNDHVIAGNDIARVCRDTGDAGAFYIGRDWTARGNIVRNNYFHQIGGSTAGLRGWTNVNAIYLDDCASGTTVTGNICRDMPTGVQLGGGRDDKIERNVFIDCHTAFMVDARGLGWAKNSLAPGGGWHMDEKLAAVHYDQPPYSARYPELATILTDNPGAPKGDVISGNIISGGGPKWLDIEGAATPFVTVTDNLTNIAVAVTRSELRVNPLAPVTSASFPPLPLDQIGLYTDRARAILPDAAMQR